MASKDEYTLAYVVVDDDDDDVFVLREALQQANRQLPLHEFSDGQEFIDYLTQHATEPGHDTLNWLVILDIDMPRLDGLETLSILRQNPLWSKFPVLMLSTSSEPKLIEAVYRLGANGIITKPNSVAELVRIFDQFFVPLLLVERP